MLKSFSRPPHTWLKRIGLFLLLLLILFIIAAVSYFTRYYFKEIHPYRAIIDLVLKKALSEHRHLPKPLTIMIEVGLGCPNLPEERPNRNGSFNCDNFKNDLIANMVYNHALFSNIDTEDDPHKGTLHIRIKRYFISRFIISNMTEADKNTLFCDLAHFGQGYLNKKGRLEFHDGCHRFSQHYFHKPLAKLSMEEAALIIAISKAPNYYLNDAEGLKQRQQYLLQMAKSFE